MRQLPHTFDKNFCQLVENVMATGKAAGLAALMVNKSGTVIYERYFGFRDIERQLPVTADTLFGLASITKSFTAVAIMQLAEQHKISLDDPVSRYIPSFKNKNRKDCVLIKHLLSHSGGYYPLPRILIDDIAVRIGVTESQDGDFAYLKPLAEAGITAVASRLDSQEKLIGYSGELLSYCNDGFALLSDIVRTQGDCSSFAEYLEKHILEPLGMNRTTCSFMIPATDENASILYSWEKNGSLCADRNYHNDAFVLNGGGALKSTPSDMGKYITMYLNRGSNLNHKQIISPSSVYEMCRPRQYMAPHIDYGYGIERMTHDLFPYWGHGGSLPGVSSEFLWSDDLEAGIIILCNTMDVSTGFLAKAALRLYSGGTPEENRPQYPSYTWDKQYVMSIAGTYSSGEGDSLTLNWNKDAPSLTLNGKEILFVPISSDKALVRKQFADTYLEILRDTSSNIRGARYGSRIFPKTV